MKSLYNVGQTVVYGIHGICKIVDIQIMRVNKKDVEYFVLEPIGQPGSRYFIPCNNDNVLGKLRPVLPKSELDQLLKDAGNLEDGWISDENLRKLRYRELINGGDRVALLCMIRSLYKHKSEQLAAGRKFHQCDENFLRDAEKLLSAEFALVLGIKPDEVGTYIQSKVNSL